MADRTALDESQRHSDDESTLHKLGYAQVLYREMGGFSNFAISFTIISILAGCLTSYFIAFNSGGPVAVVWGWLLVGIMCTFVGLAMGEIASAMPTAGAIYYWASKLGRPVHGWFSGWFNLIGVIAVTAAIDYGAATFWTALLNLWFDLSTSTTTIFIVFSVIVALHLTLNLLNVRLLALLNTVSAWWHMAGVAVIVVVLAVVPDHHQSVGFVFGETLNASGFGSVNDNFGQPAFWFVFALGLLMAQYTITGFDASAHMSEETRQASRSAALGIVMSIVVSVIFGFVLLVAITFAVPQDIKAVQDSGAMMVPFIWQNSMSNSWAEFLLFIACVAQFFCGTASVTSASRMMFAFSRDGAVPGRNIWRKVASNRVPVNAVIAVCFFAWALMIPTLANGAIGYLVGTSVAVIGLYMAFAIPIYLRWRAGDSFEQGAWNLGKRYKWIDPLAFLWIGFITILFLLPTTPTAWWFASDFDWNVANYAPLTVGGVLIVVWAWWQLSARKWFKGPVREGTDEELLRLEHGDEAVETAPA
jgi:amino acid transporter